MFDLSFKIIIYVFLAWVPTWAFGRKFELGKNLNRLPEQNLGQLIGLANKI